MEHKGPLAVAHLRKAADRGISTKIVEIDPIATYPRLLDYNTLDAYPSVTRAIRYSIYVHANPIPT